MSHQGTDNTLQKHYVPNSVGRPSKNQIKGCRDAHSNGAERRKLKNEPVGETPKGQLLRGLNAARRCTRQREGF